MKITTLVLAAAQVISLPLLMVPAAAQSAPYSGHATYLEQGWTSDTARWWYFLSQGTAFMPYEWFLALEQPVGTELFSAPGHMQRLGFLIEPPDQRYNPAGLPVGFAKTRLDVDRSRYACWKGDWVGFACAACHTGQLNYHGQQIRIEGGAARHDIELFGREIGQALAATAADAGKFSRFAQRVAATMSPPPPAADLAASFRCYVNEVQQDAAFLQAAQSGSTEPPTHPGFGRLDAHERGVNLFLAAPLKEPKNYVPETAPVRFPPLWDTPYFDWVLYNAAISQPLPRNVIEALGVQAPIRHETILQEKIVHSLNMDGIVSGQRSLRDLKSPEWPEAILGLIDVAKANRGREVYNRLCLACHQVIDRVTHSPRGAGGAGGDIVIPTYDLTAIGTDPRQAQTFERRKVSLEKIGGPAEIASSKAGELVAGKISSQWIAESPANAKRAAEINVGRPHEFRALLVYRARPLNGIWAMAPYLHNGSVPSLYELLLPASQRSKEFYVGSWEFNPDKVGLESDSPFTGAFKYDTSLPGNSNAGHEYGADLNDEDRRALIEYLKTL
jgi:RoxA-like, cytochrome c-like